MMADLETEMRAAINSRESGSLEEARQRLLALLADHPDHPELNLQVAWSHDKMGFEREAVPYYEAALDGGLNDQAALDAMLGLGSTLRALGHYERARSVLTEAVDRFPDHRGLRVFFALASYNDGDAKTACETLLSLLVETTGDETVRSYRSALEIYAEDLDRTW